MAPKCKVFNTYVSGTIEEQLQKLELYKKVVLWFIGQHEEGKKNGLPHFQLMFGFKWQKSLHAVQTMGLPEGENIQCTKDSLAMKKYVTNKLKRVEGTEPILFGEVPEFKTIKRTLENSADPMRDLIEAGGDKVDILKRAKTGNITWYAKNQKQLKAVLNELISDPDNAIYKITDFNVQPLEFKGKHILLIGKSGVGKTQFALSHFKAPLLIQTKEDWGRYREGTTDGLVMDDLALRNWQTETLIKALNWDVNVTYDVKFGSAVIPGKIPRFVLVNSIKCFWPNGILDEHKAAIARRLECYEVHGKLFGNEISSIVPINIMTPDDVINAMNCRYCSNYHSRHFRCIESIQAADEDCSDKES